LVFGLENQEKDKDDFGKAKKFLLNLAKEHKLPKLKEVWVFSPLL